GNEPATQLLGEVRQPLVEPGVLRRTPTYQHVLVEADHVLELVDEYRRERLGRERLADGATRRDGPRDDSVKDLASVRMGLAGQQIEPEEEPQDDAAARVAVRGELVDVLGEQHDHDAVVVEVRLPGERGSVDRIEIIV